MAAIILPSRWQRQPTYPAQLNDASPLSRGVQLLWSGAFPTFPAVGGYPTIVGATAPAFLMGGASPDFAGASYFKWSRSLLGTSPTTGTLFALVSLNDVSEDHCPISLSDSTGYNYSLFRLDHQPGTGWMMQVRAADGLGYSQAEHGSNAELRRLYAVVGVLENNIARVYVDGKKTTSSASMDGHTISVDLTTIGVLLRASPIHYHNGTILLSGASATAWNDSDVFEFTNAPWQLFAPIKRRIYFGTTGTALTFTKATLTHLGKPQYSNAKYVPTKTTLTNTGKSSYLNQKLTATKAALTLAGKTLLSNAKYVASKAALTLSGKSAYLNSKFAVTKAAITIAGKSVYSNAKHGLSKATLTIAGKTFTITGLVAEIIAITKAALALSGKSAYLNERLTATKAALTIAGKSVYSNASHVMSKASMTLSGKTAKLNEWLTAAKAALTIVGKDFTTSAAQIINLVKTALALSGKSVYSNAKYTFSKASLTLTGKDFATTTGAILQLAKAALTLAGQTVKSNSAFVASKAALTLAGKAVTANAITLITAAVTALTLAGKDFSTKADTVIALTKTALTLTGKAFVISSALVKKWAMWFEAALRGRTGQLVVSGSTTLASIFGTTPKQNEQVTFASGSGDLYHTMTCYSQSEVVGSRYPAFFIESTTDIDYSQELYMSSAEAEVIEETAA